MRSEGERGQQDDGDGDGDGDGAVDSRTKGQQPREDRTRTRVEIRRVCQVGTEWCGRVGVGMGVLIHFQPGRFFHFFFAFIPRLLYLCMPICNYCAYLCGVRAASRPLWNPALEEMHDIVAGTLIKYDLLGARPW